VNKDGSRTHIASGEKEYEPPAQPAYEPTRRVRRPGKSSTSTPSPTTVQQTNFATTTNSDKRFNNNVEYSDTSSNSSDIQNTAPKKLSAKDFMKLVEDEEPVFIPPVYEKSIISESKSQQPAVVSKRVFNVQQPKSQQPAAVSQQKLDLRGRSGGTKPLKTETNNVKDQSRYNSEQITNKPSKTRSSNNNSPTTIEHVNSYAQIHKSTMNDLVYDLPDSSSDEEPEENISPEEKLYYSKKPRDVQFKPHTLNEYKMINQPIKLGGLGADLNNEKLIAKKEKANKIKEYAREVAMANHAKVKGKQPKDNESAASVSDKKLGPSSSRQKALEFASKIPKPQVKRKKASDDQPKKPSSDDDLSDREPEPLSELELLDMKHQQEKEWMEREFGNYVL
jgi:hypothetical protein